MGENLESRSMSWCRRKKRGKMANLVFIVKHNLIMFFHSESGTRCKVQFNIFSVLQERED